MEERCALASDVCHVCPIADWTSVAPMLALPIRSSYLPVRKGQIDTGLGDYSVMSKEECTGLKQVGQGLGRR